MGSHEDRPNYHVVVASTTLTSVLQPFHLAQQVLTPMSLMPQFKYITSPG